MIKDNCKFCDEIINKNYFDGIIVEHICPVCGTYYTYYNEFEQEIKFSKNTTASFLFHKRDLNNRFLGTKKQFDIVNEKYKNKHFNLITEDDIQSFYPKNFSDKISNILIWLDSNTRYAGQNLRLKHREYQSLLFLQRDVEDIEIDLQYRVYSDYLYHQKQYIKLNEDDDGINISLTPLGYERIEKFQLENKNNKKVFVAMAFNENTEKIREAIRSGIREAKYDATLIDEIIHNKQIVPEMFRLIRESRLLVMDISEPNYGAYYEAGYAQGLGKEVIITCSKEVFNKTYETPEEKKFEKFLKPHFDIRQKQILVWKDDEDLITQLSEWIKALE